MKIAAKTEISPHEEALIQDFIKQMKQEHPNLELSLNDIYDSAFRTGIDIVLEQIRTALSLIHISSCSYLML